MVKRILNRKTGNSQEVNILKRGVLIFDYIDVFIGNAHGNTHEVVHIKGVHVFMNYIPKKL